MSFRLSFPRTPPQPPPTIDQTTTQTSHGCRLPRLFNPPAAGVHSCRMKAISRYTLTYYLPVSSVLLPCQPHHRRHHLTDMATFNSIIDPFRCLLSLLSPSCCMVLSYLEFTLIETLLFRYPFSSRPSLFTLSPLLLLTTTNFLRFRLRLHLRC